MWEKQNQINPLLTTFMFLFNRNFWDVLSGDMLVWWWNEFLHLLGLGAVLGQPVLPLGCVCRDRMDGYSYPCAL